ncbi:hypothetical protein ACN4EK_15125 [Pantanalinema rosaneae CENA516]|uniref:hypothetical protein n=1 Tax=Pantanalinema rosaneae TaxID=1620701 RepID=UPI003D6FF2B9
MRQHLLVLGFSLLFIGSASPTLALQPASVRANDDVAWSTVVNNPFDGPIVYDRNYKNDFVFVSSWSRQGIGVTYTRVNSVLVGYDYSPGLGYGFGFDYFPRYRRGGLGLGLLFGQRTPVYRRYITDNVPDSISLAINGKVYTYEEGPVSPELAAALANAPPQNVMVRLRWKDGTIRDTEIGKDTVRAWKTIFS